MNRRPFDWTILIASALALAVVLGTCSRTVAAHRLRVWLADRGATWRIGK